jgi:hypothetical protein
MSGARRVARHSAGNPTYSHGRDAPRRPAGAEEEASPFCICRKFKGSCGDQRVDLSVSGAHRSRLLSAPQARRSVVAMCGTGCQLRNPCRPRRVTLAIGASYRALDLVFCRAGGDPLNPATVSRNFEALVKAAGLPKVRLHGLRHS